MVLPGRLSCAVDLLDVTPQRSPIPGTNRSCLSRPCGDATYQHRLRSRPGAFNAPSTPGRSHPYSRTPLLGECRRRRARQESPPPTSASQRLRSPGRPRRRGRFCCEAVTVSVPERLVPAAGIAQEQHASAVSAGPPRARRQVSAGSPQPTWSSPRAGVHRHGTDEPLARPASGRPCTFPLHSNTASRCVNAFRSANPPCGPGWRTSFNA